MADYYDSPIIVCRSSVAKFEEDVANKIISAVQEYKLDIDKEKLIAALTQDQKRYMDAYKKGYTAGYESTKNEETKNEIHDLESS